MVTLSNIAEKIIKVCVACRSNEKLLIVTDDRKKEISETFKQAALGLGIAKTSMVVTGVEQHGGHEPSPAVAKAMCEAEVIVIITTKSMSQTMARVNANKAGARIINLPDMSVKELGEVTQADFVALSPAVKVVASYLEKGSQFRVMSAAGTDLSFSGEGHHANALDSIADKPGLFRSMSFEANIGPVDETAKGTLVIDGSLVSVGVLKEKITCRLEKGQIVDIQGGSQAKKFAEVMKAYKDPQMYMLAEFGIGMNPCVRVTGDQYIADESALGSAHFGFGTNLVQGGNRKAAAHFDAIILKPDIEIDGTTIMKNGLFTIPLNVPSLAAAMQK